LNKLGRVRHPSSSLQPELSTPFPASAPELRSLANEHSFNFVHRLRRIVACRRGGLLDLRRRGGSRLAFRRLFEAGPQAEQFFTEKPNVGPCPRIRRLGIPKFRRQAPVIGADRLELAPPQRVQELINRIQIVARGSLDASRGARVTQRPEDKLVAAHLYRDLLPNDPRTR
jgi:hypothetical protein